MASEVVDNAALHPSPQSVLDLTLGAGFQMTEEQFSAHEKNKNALEVQRQEMDKLNPNKKSGNSVESDGSSIGHESS